MSGRAFEIESCFIAQAMRRKPLTVDFRDPALQGGGWLNVYRAAREAIRRAKLKAARKAKPKGGAQG
jgi:hypothetical protein